MELESGISKKIKKPFLVDEDGLRRIEGVLLKAAPSFPEELKVVYHVERMDDRFYETPNIEEVLDDPNVIGRAIRILGIELRKVSSLESKTGSNEGLVAWVVFDKDRPPYQQPFVRLRIASPDRTWALMLADDIEPQVTRVLKAKAFRNWIFFLYAPVIGLFVYRIALWMRISPPEALTDGVIGTMMAFAVVITSYKPIAMLGESMWPYKFLIAQPAFLWGDEKSAFEEREALRNNVFWGVAVGFLVSLGAGIATLLI